jgi:hypothetical protein
MLSAFTLTAYAKDGFSGFFDIGVLTVISDDALLVAGNSEEIDSTAENADGFSVGAVIALFNVRYKDKDLTYHAGTPLETGKPDLSIGVTKSFGASSFDVSLLVNPFTEVWENPFAPERDSTSDMQTGLKLTWSQVGGTPHNAVLVLRNHNIKDDTQGEIYPELNRDGYTFDISVSYDFSTKIGKVSPEIGYAAEIRDGDAESSQTPYIGVLIKKKLDKDFIMGAVRVGGEFFDAENPYFEKERRDITSAAFVMYKLADPFGWEKKHFTFMGGTAKRLSNIDFYDAVTLFAGVSFGFDF